MRPQSLTREQITSSLAVIGHADRNVDRRAIEADGQRVRNIVTEPDFVKIAIEENRHPAIAEPVEANRPAAGLRVHFGRVGTIAMGMKV